MGIFSWMTSDTNDSVSSVGGRCKMIIPDGTEFIENDYQGYGEFDGKDFFSMVAHLNGYDHLAWDDDDKRDHGLEIYWEEKPDKYKYPKIVSIGFNGSYDDVPNSVTCPHQGYFYE